jgi:transcriptional regulator with XRE-family HTH domain
MERCVTNVSKRIENLQFSQYLRTCREHARLTQEQLTHALYAHDIESFEALDMSMLSKWERGVIQPKISKQVSIVKYFQKRNNRALPCFDNYTVDKAEALLCETGMKNLLGKSKKLVLEFPSSVIGIDDLMVYHVRNSENFDKYIAINVDLDRGFTHDYSQLDFERFKSWASNPVNSFYVCEYKEQFFGLLFTLRVKPEIFDKLMKFEIDEKALTNDDFARFDEKGSNYMLSFFAMNDKAATLLFIRYYAHLIANQNVIDEVGTASMMEDAKKLIGKMQLHTCERKTVSDDLIVESFRASLPTFLAHERVLKMLLSKQDIPSE